MSLRGRKKEKTRNTRRAIRKTQIAKQQPASERSRGESIYGEVIMRRARKKIVFEEGNYNKNANR